LGDWQQFTHKLNVTNFTKRIMRQPCPLCLAQKAQELHHDQYRAYRHCPVCDLIYVARDDLLSPEEEKTRYDLHENNPNDLDYQAFLNQLTQPLLERLGQPPLKGLDFGSGPGPTLPIMLAEQGYSMRIYDHFYAPNPQVLEESYDFITCSEAFEHFYNPRVEWCLLVDLVKPGGWLGIMTLMLPSPEAFADWHYKNDRTHVSFFSRNTFLFLAKRDDLKVEFIGENVILYQKPEGWQQPIITNRRTIDE
jgi:SAM-dependent methyltransferase